METLNNICNKPVVKCLLAAVVLVLIIVCLKFVIDLKNAKPTEHMAYSSGATLRFLSDHTSSDQGQYTTGYNMNKTKDINALLSGTPRENFTTPKEIRSALRQEEVLANQLYNECFSNMESPDEKVINELKTISEYM